MITTVATTPGRREAPSLWRDGVDGKPEDVFTGRLGAAGCCRSVASCRCLALRLQALAA